MRQKEDMEVDSDKVVKDATGQVGNNAPPELMTEGELIEFLRIPAVSKARDHGHVIEHLKRMRDLPCIHICRQPLYPLMAIRDWIQQQAGKESRR